MTTQTIALPSGFDFTVASSLTKWTLAAIAELVEQAVAAGLRVAKIVPLPNAGASVVLASRTRDIPRSVSFDLVADESVVIRFDDHAAGRRNAIEVGHANAMITESFLESAKRWLRAK